MRYDIAIIGGGASGLACAAYLLERKNLNIAIIDSGDRLAKKLAATGNGQGNISNIHMDENHYFGSCACFSKQIACNSPYDGSTLFDCLFENDEKGRIYPTGRQASALSDCLIKKTQKAQVFLGVKVVDIQKGFVLTLSDNKKIEADYVVFCVGGKAQKQFKTDGTSYSLVQKFGHKITQLYPSLVQLKTDTKYTKTLKGIRTECNATALSNNQELMTVKGDVIFTEYGISGNAIFSLSPYITGKENCTIRLEFLPNIEKSIIANNIEKRKKLDYQQSELLSGTLHNTLGRAIIARAIAENQNIAHLVKNFTLPIIGTLGFDYAQVTRGGISADGVSELLESKYINNLFFAGEVLDIDGDCGGYNLQWAFTSGMFVAKNILKRLG